ncbi:MAG: glycoside hydrolase family protein [Deltaproteobacteria bacterium]|nr:glycoside hydrolase family protein [Deltaproteobacteria bacterium]
MAMNQHNQAAMDLIKRQEGLRLKPYRDTEGVLTIGYGRNLEEGITLEEAAFLFLNDFYRAQGTVMNLFPDWVEWDEQRLSAMISMMYNLGLPRFLTFEKMIAAIEAGDWARAAAEMRDSKWFKQVPERVDELAGMVHRK